MACDLKFNGSFKEVNQSLAGVVFCGENGGPCILADIRLGEDQKDDTIPVYEFVFQVSSYKRPSESDAAEPIETRLMSAIWSLKQPNQDINLRQLNDGFGLTGTPLAIQDDGEDHFRLVAEDSPKTLVHLIGKPTHSMYLKAAVQIKGEDEVKAIYYNFFSPPMRQSAKGNKIKLADLKKKFKKDDAPSF